LVLPQARVDKSQATRTQREKVYNGKGVVYQKPSRMTGKSQDKPRKKGPPLRTKGGALASNVGKHLEKAGKSLGPAETSKAPQ